MKKILIAIIIAVSLTALSLVDSRGVNLGFGSVLVGATEQGWPQPYHYANYQYGGDACFTRNGCPSGGRSMDSTHLIEDLLFYTILAFVLILAGQKLKASSHKIGSK